MNSLLTRTENKLNKIIQAFRDQGRSPSPIERSHFTLFIRMISLLKTESEMVGDKGPELLHNIVNECALIEAELEKIALKNSLCSTK